MWRVLDKSQTNPPNGVWPNSNVSWITSQVLLVSHALHDASLR